MSYIARLSFAVVLEISTEAQEAQEAHAIVQALEARILAAKWQSENALGIKAAAETNYFSKIDIANESGLARLE